jgi:predicted transport protein
MLFKIHNKTLAPVRQKNISREKILQQLIEHNLEKIFSLTLVKSEFSIKGRKIDTLAYDSRAKAFCIIECKKEKSLTVFDQGITYLNLMLENRGELVNEYNELCSAGLKRRNVNWQGSRVIFAAPVFTPNQVQAADFWETVTFGRGPRIELWEFLLFENGEMLVNPLRHSPAAEAGDDGLPLLTEEAHLVNKPAETIRLYNELKKTILTLDRKITIKPKKLEIGFVLNGKKFTDVSIHHGYIKLWLNLKRGRLKDTMKIARDVSGHRHWGSGDYELRLRDTKNLKYVKGLIKQTLTPLPPSPPRRKTRDFQ